METLKLAVVTGSAFAAGVMNSVAGGGTLVSFPALLWYGLTAQQANITSTIALWPGSVGGVVGHRRDMAGTRRFALRLVPPSLAGGIAGALLLLATPAPVFDHIVPWLILVATLLFAAKEPINRRFLRPAATPHRAETTQPAPGWSAAIGFQFVVALYGGYFGAGIGIMMLAALGLLGLTDIHQMNGLKNFLAISINGVAVLLFAFSGQVDWVAAGVMAAAAILGGLAGAALAHRLGRRMVNAVVVVIGALVATWFFTRG